MVSFHTIFPSEGASLSSSHGSALRKRGFRALRSATKDAVFGNCKPFEKGLTENLTSAASGQKSTPDSGLVGGGKELYLSFSQRL